MDKKIILRILYFFISIPVITFSAIYFIFNKKIRDGLNLSKDSLVHDFSSTLEINLISYLVAGEDHRFYNHLGFDPIAIARASFTSIFKGRIEGASTIEQQYVRTCTKHYEISINRKIEEIAISSLLSLSEKKNVIAYSYLKIAHYGNEASDANCARTMLGKIYPIADKETYRKEQIISLLKNPIPKIITESWKNKHTQRSLHIRIRHTHLNHTNKSRQKTPIFSQL